MTYIEFVCNTIYKYSKTVPIYSKNISEDLQNAFCLEYKKAAAACAVAIKRILDDKIIPDLRTYQNGIYYLTSVTPFGELGINKERLIADKYLNGGIGYEGGTFLLNLVGLSTQIPRERLIITNKAVDGLRADKQLNVMIKPPKTPITMENKAYLQTLDMMDLLDNAPIDTENPYQIIASYMKTNGVEYAPLLSIADSYYPRDIIFKIARVARYGGYQ